jgi:CRP-like cAMP-binding protein
MEIPWHITERDFFWDLPKEKKEFISLSTLRLVEKNQVLFFPGDTGDSAFYLEEGKVRIFRVTPVGKETIVFIRQPGEMFGLAEILGEQKRVFSAQAITPCRLYEIKKKEFELLLERRFSVARRVIEVLGRRIRYLGEQIESLMISDVPSRLLKLLICLCCHDLSDLKALQKPISLPVKLTQEQMAAMIGSTQQTVSETLKKLREDGLIKISGKEITLLKPQEIFGLILL